MKSSLIPIILLSYISLNEPDFLIAQQYADFIVDGNDIKQEITGVGASIVYNQPRGIDKILTEAGWPENLIEETKEEIATLIFNELDLAALGFHMNTSHEYEHLNPNQRNVSLQSIPNPNFTFELNENKVLLAPLPLPYSVYIQINEPEASEVGIETKNNDWTGKLQLALYNGAFNEFIEL